MTREEIKELLPIMQAWAEGKIIQFRKKGTVQWVDLYEDDLRVSSAYHYRIKPEPKYRPFESQEECWNEMHKHPDFGWVKDYNTGYLCQINCFHPGHHIGIDNKVAINFECAFIDYLFPDGAPFGIKEE